MEVRVLQFQFNSRILRAILILFTKIRANIEHAFMTECLSFSTQASIIDGSFDNKNNRITMTTQQSDVCSTSTCSDFADSFSSVTGDHNTVDLGTSQESNCSDSFCTNSDFSFVTLDGNNNQVSRISSQTNNCGIDSNCLNNVTGIISHSGDSLTSSTQNEQSNKCFISSTCVLTMLQALMAKAQVPKPTHA